MSRKKIIISVVAIVAVAALAGGGIGAYRYFQMKKLTAEVQNVSNLNWGYGGSETSSSGMVTNDQSQDVFLLESQSVQEVLVQEGQAVSIGDPLVSYDMTMSGLKLQMKELDIDTFNNKLEAAKRELEKLKKTKPVSPTAPPVPDIPVPDPIPDTDQGKTELPEKEGLAYNYISSSTVPGKGKGTLAEPYVFLCTPECYVSGEYINSLKADPFKPVFVVFEIRENHVWEGALIAEWRLGGTSGLPNLEPDSKWSISTQTQITEEPAEDTPEELPETPPMQEFPSVEQPNGYTAQELAKMITEKEKEIRDLDLDKRKAELELEQMRKISEDGLVKATVNGIVKKVGDKENPPTDGSAFITVSGSEGLYVRGSLSELLLGDVQVGQTVFANSWESGQSFEATITEISTYPQENSNSWGEGNPNVSYYPYTAYIEDTQGLRNGEYVDLTMNSRTDGGGIYLEKAYVREEDGKNYVWKADKKDRLTKQYVVVGKTIWGQAVEIVSGLTLEDRIAFPYGKTVKEGVKVTEPSGGVMYR